MQQITLTVSDNVYEALTQLGSRKSLDVQSFTQSLVNQILEDADWAAKADIARESGDYLGVQESQAALDKYRHEEN